MKKFLSKLDFKMLIILLSFLINLIYLGYMFLPLIKADNTFYFSMFDLAIGYNKVNNSFNGNYINIFSILNLIFTFISLILGTIYLCLIFFKKKEVYKLLIAYFQTIGVSGLITLLIKTDSTGLIYNNYTYSNLIYLIGALKVVIWVFFFINHYFGFKSKKY